MERRGWGPPLLPPRTWYACTISSTSHSVPDPLRSTSSGGRGMMVDRLQGGGGMRQGQGAGEPHM